MALAVGSIFLSDKEQHSIHDHEKKQSPKRFAENPPLLMFHPYESYLKPAVKIIKFEAYCHFLALFGVGLKGGHYPLVLVILSKALWLAQGLG